MVKGEIILRQFNKVCKNLNESTIELLLNDLKTVDSFKNLDVAEKELLVDIMYKFNKLCIKFNIDKTDIINDFNIQSNSVNNNIELKKSLQDIIKKDDIKKIDEKQEKQEKQAINQQTTTEENPNITKDDHQKINSKILQVQKDIIPFYKNIFNKEPEFEDFNDLFIDEKNELLKSLDLELEKLKAKSKEISKNELKKNEVIKNEVIKKKEIKIKEVDSKIDDELKEAENRDRELELEKKKELEKKIEDEKLKIETDKTKIEEKKIEVEKMKHDNIRKGIE